MTESTRSEVNWTEIMRYSPDTEPNWDEVFSNAAVLDALDNCPPNNAPYHDREEDERILENMRRRAPRLNRIMSMAIAETAHDA